MLQKQPTIGSHLRHASRLAGRVPRQRRTAPPAELSAAESELIAEALATAGDVLIRTAIGMQPASGPAFDELMNAGQDLLERGNELAP